MTRAETVIMDTNALLAPGRSGVHVFDEIERVVGAAELLAPEAVVRELRRLARDDPDAELALDLLDEECRVVEGDDGRHADDVIVEMAERLNSGEGDDATAGGEERPDDGGVAVATNDAGLRDRLHGVDVPVLFLRQEQHVEISYP